MVSFGGTHAAKYYAADEGNLHQGLTRSAQQDEQTGGDHDPTVADGVDEQS
jgi:hypothetical protein